MVVSAIHITIVILLFFVMIQDLRYRAIHILLPVAIFVLGIIRHVIKEWFWIDLLMNILFVLLIMAGLAAYLSLKNRRAVNPFKMDIGWGDVLFLLAVTPLFSSMSYMFFFISGMLLAIVCHIINHCITKTRTIPLAGYLAGYIILISGFLVIAPEEAHVFFNRLLV